MNIVIAGDFCPQDRVSRLFDENRFDIVLGEVKAIIDKSDYAIVNLECPIIESNGSPISKCGPNLKCSESGIEAIKWAGFNCVTLANNHFFDYGEEGVENTIKACKDRKIDVVGGGINIYDASQTLYKEISGKKLAIINCCEHEFSVASERTGGSNPLNPIQQYYAIQDAKIQSDYVIIIIHGGNENYQLPSPRMQDTYRFFIDAGADAVVNHHQHCYSGYEVYKEKPIFYGLGNFCFDEKNQGNIWKEGVWVCLNLNEEIVSFNLIPYKQCDVDPIVKVYPEGEEAFVEKLERLNEIILNRQLLDNKYNEYLSTYDNTINELLEPYSNKYLLALFRRKLLPSIITNNKRKLLLAYLQCESHMPKIIHFLKN